MGLMHRQIKENLDIKSSFLPYLDGAAMYILNNAYTDPIEIDTPKKQMERIKNYRKIKRGG